MRNSIINHHSVGSSLSDNRMLEEGILASMCADSFGSLNIEQANDFTADIAHPSMKDIPMWIVLSSTLFTRDQDDDDDDDYQDPDDDEILDTMFPDEDDDFWNDNYDVD